MGSVTGVHHHTSAVIGVQQPNDSTLYEVVRHLLLGSAKKANAHLSEVRKKSPKAPPNAPPANPKPEAIPPTNPEDNNQNPPEENKKTDPQAYPPTNPTTALYMSQIALLLMSKSLPISHRI